MDRKPFEPADGATPRWQKLHDLVLTKKVNDEVTYREAAEALGFASMTDRVLRIVQAAMRDAVKNLEKRGNLTLATVAKFGWVVLTPERELQQVDRRVVKTRRAAGRALRGGDALNTRRDQLSTFDRDRLDGLRRSAMMAAQVTGTRGMDLNELKNMIEGAKG